MADDEQVVVPFGDNPGETATLLLAAAEELDQDQGVVRTVEGAFQVPADVAEKAGFDEEGKPKKGAAKKAAKKAQE
jgi:hypothetical protein